MSRAPFQVTLRRNLSGLGIWCCVSLRLQHPDALIHHRHHSHEAPKAVEPPRPGQVLLAVERALLSQQLPFVLAACHIINIVAMTIASAGMTEEARAGTHYVNLIITVVFALKTAGQLAVLGVMGFGASWSRVLEGIVTLISLVRPRLDRECLCEADPCCSTGRVVAADGRALRRERASLLLRAGRSAGR